MERKLWPRAPDVYMIDTSGPDVTAFRTTACTATHMKLAQANATVECIFLDRTLCPLQIETTGHWPKTAGKCPMSGRYFVPCSRRLRSLLEIQINLLRCPPGQGSHLATVVTIHWYWCVCTENLLVWMTIANGDHNKHIPLSLKNSRSLTASMIKNACQRGMRICIKRKCQCCAGATCRES